MAWSVERVIALAPNPLAARAGRDLALPGRWSAAGHDERAVWGEVQGTAATPYQVSIELGGPRFACTCPSTRVPCKHALGLLLLFARSAVPMGDPPERVREWLAAPRSGTPDAPGRPAPLDPERASLDQHKRVQRRQARMADGVADLEVWLDDVVRGGLIDLAARPRATFDQMAARLVDAQAPGLARAVRNLGYLPHTGDRWPERMVISLGRLHLLLEAYRRLDTLTPGVRGDVRTQLGWNLQREEVLVEPAVHDDWLVLGERVIDDERFRIQRSWLWGRTTGRWALMLDFAAGGAQPDRSFVPGTVATADLSFFPSALPLRALAHDQPALVDRVGALPPPRADDVPGVAGAFDRYARALACNPWLELYPIALHAAMPLIADDRWWLADPSQQRLALGGPYGWRLLAVSGGRPIDVFGEYNGSTLWPLAVAADGEYLVL